MDKDYEVIEADAVRVDNQPLKSHHRYDRFFKRCMTDLSLARELIEQTLPHVAALYDLSSLELPSVEHTHVLGRLLQSDIVYKLKKRSTDPDNAETGFVYLLWEHQSTPDKHMLLRVLEYTILLMKRHVMTSDCLQKGRRKQASEQSQRQSSSKEPPYYYPAVYSMVLYHGTTVPYPFPTQLIDYYKDKKEGMLMLRGHGLRSIPETSDAQLLDTRHAALMEVVLKYIREFDFKPTLALLREHLRKGMISSAVLTKSVVEFILREAQFPQPISAEALYSYISNDMQGVMMTLEMYWRAEAKEEGRVEGRVEGREEGRVEALMQIKQDYIARMHSLGLKPELIDKIVAE